MIFFELAATPQKGEQLCRGIRRSAAGRGNKREAKKQKGEDSTNNKENKERETRMNEPSNVDASPEVN